MTSNQAQKISDAIIAVLRTVGKATPEIIHTALEAQGIRLTIFAIRDWLRDHHEIVDFDGSTWIMRSSMQSTGSIISQVKRELSLAEEKIRSQRAQIAALTRELESYRNDQDRADKPPRDELEGKITALQQQVEQLAQKSGGFSQKDLEILESLTNNLDNAAGNVRMLMVAKTPPRIQPGSHVAFVSNKPVMPKPHDYTPERREPWIITLLKQVGKEMTYKEIMNQTGKKYENVHFAVKSFSGRLTKRKDGQIVYVGLKAAAMAEAKA